MGPQIEAAIEKVCKGCLEANLVEDVRIARCGKCDKRYCSHFASNIDPAQCTECLSDVSMIKEVVVKTYEHYDEETDTTTSYRRKARSIRLEGMDWLFAQRKICTLSDDALELAIEYHREILQGMLAEREDRRNKKAHRYANVNFQVDTAKSTETKTTKKISSSKAQANANGVLQAMQAAGLSITDILKLLEGVQKK